jgi:hypothetical protein
MPDTETTSSLHHIYEPNPDPQSLTSPTSDTKQDRLQNVSNDVDYEPHPEKSIPISPAQQEIINKITSLYSAQASESNMAVYAKKSIYDDPWSYCDTRYKIAGQWYGIPMIFSSSKTIATEVVKADNVGKDGAEIIFKLRQEYTPKVLEKLGGKGKTADSLVSLTLDEQGKVRYHKDMWNEKDYSHGGLGKIMKTLNGDQLTKITRPPESL